MTALLQAGAAPYDLVLRGGAVIDTSGKTLADVAIRDGKIAALLDPGRPAAALAEIDVTERYLMPGLVDAHVHLREPGMTHKEDFVSGTRAAAVGGVLTLLVMPTDEPWTSSLQDLEEKIALAQGRLHVDVAFQVALRLKQINLAALRKRGIASFEIFTADVPETFLHETLDCLSEAVEKLVQLDVTIGISPGDQSMLISDRLKEFQDYGGIGGFLRSRPPLAEANGIARAILCAAKHSARVHVRQINSALGVATLRQLKPLANVTAETTPQCLLFTAEEYARQGAAVKASPPLRDEADRAALLGALREGLIDIVASDHAPHTLEEKNIIYPTFSEIPGGFAGLQTLLPVMLHLVDRGEIGLGDLVRVCAFNPAQRFGIGDQKGAISVGCDADILVLNPTQKSMIENGSQVSKAGHTPFAGLVVPYRLEAALKGGAWIFKDGRVSDELAGRVLTPKILPRNALP